jgi:protein-tyrosine phosphatase
MAAEFAILTVCTGNVHRSPLAAELLQTWSAWYLPASLSPKVRVRSAGFAAPVGSPMGSHVRVIARALGANGTTHAATQITEELIAESDLVLVASLRQRDEVLARVPSALRVTFTMREAGRIAAGLTDAARPHVARDLINAVALMARHRADHADPAADDVIDPQGRDLAAYAQMTREEVIPLAHLAALLLGMPRADMRAYIAAAEDSTALFVALGAADAQ